MVFSSLNLRNLWVKPGKLSDGDEALELIGHSLDRFVVASMDPTRDPG
jgi:hypothetical protein